MAWALEASVPSGHRRQGAGRLVLSPHEPLVEGGPAEEFEHSIQARIAEGYPHLVVDCSGVSRIDAAGIRALVRGHTTARRHGGSLRLAHVNADVRAFLHEARLDAVFPMLDSVAEAQAREWPWRTFTLVGAAAAFCAGLYAIGTVWLPPETLVPANVDFGTTGNATPPGQPFLALLKLTAAAGIALLITSVHRPLSAGLPNNRSMEQAQMLLCVAGAMVMIIIGNSVARAFGVAGAASLIRFRTPVEDPKDITILFLLMGLGMATGLGAFAVAGLGTGFLCVFLLLLDRLPSDGKPRELMVELKADSREFPTVPVESVFARHGIIYQARDVSQGRQSTVKYQLTLDRRLPVEDLGAQLTAISGITSVAWKKVKKGTS
ncbi:MAG TPA: STAS domain-containing protein [Vicinamibacterales bacterium]|nr:STAS domain-containing protein [Vicinamibacterales bacterium]